MSEGTTAGRDWLHMAQDREAWRRLGEAFVQQWTQSG